MNHGDGVIVSFFCTIIMISTAPICWAFLTTTRPSFTTRTLLSGSSSPPLLRCDQPIQKQAIVINQLSSSRTSLLRLRASSSSPSNNKTKPPSLPKTDDPFILLGLDPTTDAKAIKSAYRKRAMKYHPDVILNTDSSPKERDAASKVFARINAAYETLTGGDAKVRNDGATGSSSGGDYTYQPPHRRQSGYSSSSTSSTNNSGKSINWEDFMPKYDEEDAKYDSGGDTFGSIFSDLLSGAAGYAVGAVGGGGGVMGDLIDFLERNVGGFESGSYDDDTSLSQLLSYGTFDEVASEMDEVDILVSSLETKMNTVENDLIQAQANLNVAIKFSEKLDIEERIAELKAREKVVKGYLKKGKKRLIRLRERYKELIVDGRGGRGYGDTNARGDANSSTSSSSSRTSSRTEPAQSPPSSSASSTFSTPSSAPASSSASASAPVSSPTNSWRNEGFRGSYGRTSSSSSRRSSRRGPVETSTTEASSDPAPTNVDRQLNQQKSSRQNESGNSVGGTIVPQQYEPWVPPHRRTQSTAERDTQVKKRLRDLEVDDDFDKLKREMGM